MNPNSTDASFKVKYITGPTILSNRPGEIVFYGDNKVKAVLEAHKDEPESTLFDVPVSAVEVYVAARPNRAGNTSQQYIVSGKGYDFMPNDGTFSGDIKAINAAMKTGGATVPDGVTASTSNKAVIAITVIGVIAVAALFIYQAVK